MGFDGEELSQDRKKGAPENRSEGQALPLRHMPQTKPEACKNARSVVLPSMPAPRCGRWTRRRKQMTIIGNHMMFNVHKSLRERVRTFYLDVLQCTMMPSPAPDLDLFLFPDSFVLGVFFFASRPTCFPRKIT